MDISNNLKIFLEKKKQEGISATIIAKKLNISNKTLSNYVNGSAYIPLIHLNALCNLFNVSLDYILGFSKLENYKNTKLINELNAQEIGIRFKNIRKEHKESQQQLAELIGINKSSISRYENGESLILTLPLYIICSKYHISADYLLGKIDEPKYLN